MKSSYLTAAALAVLAFQAPAWAQRAPSDHVRCDGRPDNVSAGETAARLLGAVTLLGIFAPPPEQPDDSLRLAGAEGVAICNAALDGESNEVRRAQLILATAIHQIEAGDHDAALAEALRMESDRPTLSGSPAFRRSLGLSGMEVQAMALLGAGRLDEARDKAFAMAAATPYDLVTLFRAWPYVRLAAAFGPAEERFYQDLARLYPLSVIDRAAQRQLAGDFRGSTEDYELWMRLERTLLDHPGMTSLANAAMANALAGNVERAEELAGQSRALLEAEPNSTSAPTASEILDLYQIWKTAHEGRLADARLLFGTRTTWLKPTPAAVAEVARLLHEGATPEQLPGSMAGDPRRWVTEALERLRVQLVEGKQRFAAIRGYYAQENYDRFAANVWREGRSRYFGREEDGPLRARFISASRDGYGTPAGYAVLLHAALTAQRAGKSHFMLIPIRPQVGQNWVRIGNADDPDLIAPLAMDAAQVVADLRPLMPPPVRR